MKVEYIQPFVRAARSVLEEVSGSQTSEGMLSLQGSIFSAATVNIAAQVAGSLTGEAVYTMSTSTAQILSSRISGSASNGFGRLMGSSLSHFGEMLGQMTQKMLAECGLSCEVSAPIVFQGLNVEFSTANPALAVPIETEAGEVRVNVAVRSNE